MLNNPPHIGFNVPSIPSWIGFRVGAEQDHLGPETATEYAMPHASAADMGEEIVNPYVPYLRIGSIPLGPQPLPVTDDYCRQVIANCRTKCAERYELLGGNLGFPWMRMCIRDCVAPSGCGY